MPTPRGYVGAPIYQPNLVPQNPMNNTYVGERYVPKFYSDSAGTPTWDITKTYEPLTIVTYQGDSYTSRTYVPAGVQIDNIQFWAPTGIFNAQLEQYRMEVNHLSNEFNDYVYSNNVNYKRLQNRKILLLTNIYTHTATQTIISKYGLDITEIYSATAGFGTGTWVDIISAENVPSKQSYTDVIFFGTENISSNYQTDIPAISTYIKQAFTNAEMWVYGCECPTKPASFPNLINLFTQYDFNTINCQLCLSFIGPMYWNTSNMPNSSLINHIATTFYKTILTNNMPLTYYNASDLNFSSLMTGVSVTNDYFIVYTSGHNSFIRPSGMEFTFSASKQSNITTQLGYLTNILIPPACTSYYVNNSFDVPVKVKKSGSSSYENDTFAIIVQLFQADLQKGIRFDCISRFQQETYSYTNLRLGQIYFNFNLML